MAESFVHLHNHSEFSMLDGAARVKDMFSQAEKLGMTALAITDHGNLFGAYEFYKASKNFKVKPIIGLEAYLTPRTHRSERKRVQFGDGTGDDVASKGAYTHMTMWAATPEGMHNLFRLSTRSSLEGFFYKPRADRELLHEYCTGLIATTGCPSGEVQTFLRLGQYDSAVASAAEFRDIFGEGNFFVELMDHGLDIETRVRHDLLRLAKDLRLPLVATNDSHYVHADDADAHDTLLCVSAGSRKAQTDRFKFDGNGYYMKSPAEMRALFRELPEACDNTLAIAERIETRFDEGSGTYMPKYPVPDGETEDSWFHKEVERGLHERYRGQISDEVRERAEFETGIIAAIILWFGGWAYLQWEAKRLMKAGEGYGTGHKNEPDPKLATDTSNLPSLFVSVLPLLIVLIGNYVFTTWIKKWDPAILAGVKTGATLSSVTSIWALIIALTLAVIVIVLINRGRFFDKSFNLGSSLHIAIMGSLLAIMNTASEVGYGNVIALQQGFKNVSAFLMTVQIGDSPLLSEALMINVIAGITGSASGGIGIAMDLMGKTYLDWGVRAGISPEIIHRIASLASGGMDTLPHNGAVITLLAICGLTHRESYKFIFVLTGFKTFVAFLMVALVTMFPFIK